MLVAAETTVRAEAPDDSFDFEALFQAHYRRIARVIHRVIQDPSRADELAVDVFCKLWRHSSAHGLYFPSTGLAKSAASIGWLCVTFSSVTTKFWTVDVALI